MKKRRANRDTAALNSELIRRPIQRWFPLFLLPTFAAFCIGFLYPFCKGLFFSFFLNSCTCSIWKFLGRGLNQSCSCWPKPQPQQLQI